jgi:hypothetical protein
MLDKTLAMAEESPLAMKTLRYAMHEAKGE